MRRLFYRTIAALTGRNLKSTPLDVISSQLTEPRPLPMGRAAFEEWSDRIISGALMPYTPGDEEIFRDSQKYALANAIMHLGPTESHKPDGFFIHSLRKFAVNQVADEVRKELHAKAKARTEAKERAEAESDEPVVIVEAKADTHKISNGAAQVN